MPETVWINGQFLLRDDARVSAFDAGFQHGIGLFETIGAAGGAVVRLREHLARLEQSANELRLTESLRTGPLAEAVELAYRTSELDRARIRLTITGGDLNMLNAAREGKAKHADPTVLIHVAPATTFPDEMFDKGVYVTIADTKANPLDPFASHKTLNYWWRLRELQQAATKGAAEAIVLQVTNHVCGGCVSNLILVKDGTLITPIARGEESGGSAIPSPVLPGITREFVLGRAGEMGIPVDRRMVSMDDLLDADEVLLTNSSWGVLPVVRVESGVIGSGAVGEMANQANKAWKAQSAV